MARYNTVKIGSVYLTSNGLVGGSPCKVQVTGLPILKTDKTGQVITAADGTPYAQLIDNDQKGNLIEVITDWMSKTVFDSLVTVINNAKNSPASITIEIAGDTGNFTLGVIPAVPNDIMFDVFRNNYIKGAGFRFIIT